MLRNMQIGIIGGGNMAEALIKGLIQGGIAAGKIEVAEPVAGRRDFLAEKYSVRVSSDNGRVAADCSLILLAVKPQMADPVMAGIASAVTADTLIISIMAGATCAAIESLFSIPVRVVRAMPNTPALALQGATAIAAGTHASSEDMTLAAEIFGMVGKCWQVDEKLIDAVTGLSGSGPAYVLTFIEALSDAGVKNGLPRDTASGLALQTVFGTACLLNETGEHPALLREKVTSPGGTTIAGLQALEVGGFRGTVMRCVEAATQRSAELGKKK
ncbi:pyrroline-5-carboxylate reductase [Geobacter sp. OR-1]|uniref:pyrroline-5-carboxylate reductase n=1 Tax=Geobacter sp. OR-1 TaxID=1266765 RepID=UPI000541E6CD|nr:pyrroline-5-carboxylate reductase [Geobacter sp. OR-1]GAM07866.1 pyrroline-5-carboxylate reductase [Geobacter sp. OR-1]